MDRKKVVMQDDTDSPAGSKTYENQDSRMYHDITKPDGDYLHPLGATGVADQFKDERIEAGEFPEFNPTRIELIETVKYWAREAVRSEFSMFLANCAFSEKVSVRSFANSRIAGIGALLGEDEVQKLVEEVRNKFGEGEDPRTWRIFLHGTDEERKQVQEEWEEFFDEPDSVQLARDAVYHLMTRVGTLAILFANEPDLTKARACDGLAFSILEVLDGFFLDVPRLRLVTEQRVVINENLSLSKLWLPFDTPGLRL
jgi:hypothetical protein